MQIPSAVSLLLASLALAIAAPTPTLRAQAPVSPGGETRFEVHTGDRVLLLGDVLLEREDQFGILETLLNEEFPKENFTLRNLSWSGDTPLGVARASFDPPAKGWERLKEQIEMVKPTVAILGFGMAASLQEMSDRSGDIMLNPDPVRYGREPMTAARFKGELAQLMDELKKNGTQRFVLLSPIRHEELPAGGKDGKSLPNPAAHEKLLTAYASAIEELARERGAVFVSLRNFQPGAGEHLTVNGIHPTEDGYSHLWPYVLKALGLPEAKAAGSHEAVREAIVRKNQLFFHRWRPENYTYLFGFRKHEQGQNAKEIPEFDPLIAQVEKEIAGLKDGTVKPRPKVNPTASTLTAPAGTPPALPTFDVQPGYQIDLWATNPLLEKPIQMNFDAEGRLWVASSSTYPQVNPDDVAASIAQTIAGDPSKAPSSGNDRIIIVEASKPGGLPDKSTIFAEGLLIPTAVAPFRTADGHWGCYVGQSTELLELVDTDGDGRADRKRTVLSGFGTEDTHHLIHTLKWGPDGRLYFNQSIYIHSHLETPHGLIRMNSGAVMSWDPRTERVEVHYKGFCNPWGHVWDTDGQEFMTDGAGFQGVTWGILSAQYFTYENARKIAPSISPGSYPKFASLEIIQSPHFPQDWQGSLITCDFRAHRIVHFGVNDLSKNSPAQSGYITQELPDLVRTNDLSFRPIDVRIGPDGALYVADWSNPVINHGEVDFRDPRRDHHQGRIWKITKKDAPLLNWSKLSMSAADGEKLRQSSNPWERTQSYQAFPPKAAEPVDQAANLKSANPRTRVLAMREVCRQAKNTAPDFDALFTAALNAPANDPYYEYAAWLSTSDVAEMWKEAVLGGKWAINSPERERQLVYVLSSIDPALAAPVLGKVLAGREIPADGSGPWIELIGKSGGAPQLGELLTLLAGQKLNPAASEKALVALREALRLRGVKPAGDLAAVEPLLSHASLAISTNAARLIGTWKTQHAAELLRELAGGGTRAQAAPELRVAAIQGLRDLGGADAIATLRVVSGERPAQAVAREATVALASLDLRGAMPQVMALLADLKQDAELRDTWRAVLGIKDAPDQLASTLTGGTAASPLPENAVAEGMRIAREIGKPGQKLLTALTPLAKSKPVAAAPQPGNYQATADLVKRDGDPAKGEEIYRRANLACTICHAIGGAGGKVGPELTSLGASAPLDYIIESVVAPAAKVKEGFNAVSVTLKDGKAAVGIPSRETAEELFLRDVTGKESAVVKAQIATKELVGSIMPAGLIEQLQSREQIDLFAFLSQLGKPGVYDASKGTVARYWGLTAADPATAGAQASQATPAYTLVDGRLTRELLQAAAAPIPAEAETLFATARFQMPSAGKATLRLTGASGDAIRIDGRSLADSAGLAALDLKSGEHSVTVKIPRKTPPSALRLECAEARFLGN